MEPKAANTGYLVSVSVQTQRICESRWWARFSASVQTGPGDNTASYTMGTGSLPGVEQPGVAFTTHPHLAPRLKNE